MRSRDLCRAGGQFDVFSLHFRHFTHVMFFARAEEEHSRSATQNRDAFPWTKSHNAQGD
jgi:hypothetical protein